MSGTAIDTDHFRELLTGERERAAIALEHLHAGNSGSSFEEQEDEQPSDNHLADTATVTVDREIDYSLEENVEHALEAIDAALARIEAGTYGTCLRCGKPIGVERLEALPWVTLCIDDKRREERG
jgi:RNA polymerase-binding protein DksA